jgi:hypothetical protein
MNTENVKDVTKTVNSVSKAENVGNVTMGFILKIKNVSVNVVTNITEIAIVVYVCVAMIHANDALMEQTQDAKYVDKVFTNQTITA